MHRHIFRQDAVLYKTDHTILRILVKFSWHIPDFPIYSNGTKPGTLQFTYLQPPPTTIDPDNLAATTNSLEGGINAPIKELARRHRGLSLPHQRTVMDWWLYLHTEVPDDPVKIARDQRWGQDALSTATDLITHNTTATTNDIGAPAEYDTAIDTSYQHNLGIQKGWIK